MSFILPDWAPNTHPLIIHFPIAILHVAVLIHLLAVIFRRHRWLRHSTTLLYTLGALSVLVTYITGRQAADSVTLPPMANPILSDHADFALWTLLYFGILASVHLVLVRKNLDVRNPVSLLLFLLGAGGLILVFTTAEYGAQLVYEHGVGVQTTRPINLPKYGKTEEGVTEKIVVSENGSWYWEPGSGAPEVLENQFIWIEGKAANLRTSVDNDPKMETVLALRSDGTPFMFVGGKSISSVQADLRVKLDEFIGAVMIVHHVQDELTYDFLSLEGGYMKLGRAQEGKTKIWQEKPLVPSGWMNIRVVGDGRHFRGYSGEDLLNHGHGDELPEGEVGIRIMGSGTVLIDRIQVKSLRSQD